MLHEKIAALRVQNRDDMDGPERRPLWERCLSSFAAHAPMLAIGFTITDPVYYTQPWTGETQYLRSDEAIYEDACHEGNYSLKHILEGGRVRDGTLR